LNPKTGQQTKADLDTPVQAATIVKIAQVLHVSTDYLLGLKAEEHWEQKEETTTKNVGV